MFYFFLTISKSLKNFKTSWELIVILFKAQTLFHSSTFIKIAWIVLVQLTVEKSRNAERSTDTGLVLTSLCLNLHSFGRSATPNPVARRMYQAKGRKMRTILLRCPQVLHTPAQRLGRMLLLLTALLHVASKQKGQTFCQQLLLSGVWKKSAGSSHHFKVGVHEWLGNRVVDLVLVFSFWMTFTFLSFCSGCEELAAQFLSQEIDGQALLLLREEHLISTMNIKLGPALKICASINTLREWCFRGRTVFLLTNPHGNQYLDFLLLVRKTVVTGVSHFCLIK